MGNVGREGVLEVAPVEDEEPVETLGAGGADEALGDCIRSWATDRCPDDLDAFAAEDGVEVTRELAVAIANQEANWHRSLGKGPNELTSLLANPGAVRVGRAAGEVDAPGAKLDVEEHVQPPQGMVSTVKKSTASPPCACARRNARQESPARSPAGPRPAWHRRLRSVLAETLRPRPRSSPAILW
jgi:hypothetical protein